MDYIKFCAAVDAAALKHVSDVWEQRHLPGYQMNIYIIGRVNEEISKLYPSAAIATDYRLSDDPHDLGVWDHYVTTSIQQNERAFHYETLVRFKEGTYSKVNRVSPIIVQFQEQVKKFSDEIYQELTQDGSLSTSEFLNQFEEQLAERLAAFYERTGFGIDVTAHIGLVTSYTIRVKDPIDGAEISLELNAYREEDTRSQYTLEANNPDAGAVACPDIEPAPKKALGRVGATVEIVNTVQNKLGDLHLEHEKQLEDPAIVALITSELRKTLKDKFPKEFEFTVRVETTAECITARVEESYSGTKTRLRSTRKMETV